MNNNVKVDEETKDIKLKPGDKDLSGAKQEDMENKLLEEESDKWEKTENPEDMQNETTEDKLAKESENDQKQKTDLNDKPTDEVKKEEKIQNMQNDFTKNKSEKKVEETQKTENTEDTQNKPVDTLIADANENKEETKDIKKIVTFGNEEVKIIGQDQEKCDDDNNSSSEPNISLESNEFTDGSSHLSLKSPFEVDTKEKEEEDDDYEIPCSQMRRYPRACQKCSQMMTMDLTQTTET